MESRKFIYGLIGERLGHSHSPFLHRELGGYDYGLFELRPEDLEGFIRRFGNGGLNVTIPYKKAVLPFCTWVSPEAAEIGSINTLVLRNGEVLGYNTDYEGFIFLLNLAKIRVTGKKALVLGSGGSSLTVRRALRNLGAEQVVIISRSGKNNYENLFRHRDAGIIVNTTPVGMFPQNDEILIGLEGFPACEGVVDLIYNPLRTRLVQKAREMGIPAAGGLPMLAAQAAAAAVLFCGAEVGKDKTLLALEKLRARVENIVLIGMPGCGKTSVGKALTELSGRELIDTDEMVRIQSGRSAAEIISHDGEAAFREAESMAVSMAAKKKGVIIATGGGAPLLEDNRRALMSNGRIYFITRDLGLLETSDRPLSVNLPALYRERLPVYLKAAYTEIKNMARPEDAAKKILEVHYADMDN